MKFVRNCCIATLNPLTSRIWPVGRMFDTPVLVQSAHNDIICPLVLKKTFISNCYDWNLALISSIFSWSCAKLSMKIKHAIDLVLAFRIDDFPARRQRTMICVYVDRSFLLVQSSMASKFTWHKKNTEGILCRCILVSVIIHNNRHSCSKGIGSVVALFVLKGKWLFEKAEFY